MKGILQVNSKSYLKKIKGQLMQAAIKIPFLIIILFLSGGIKAQTVSTYGFTNSTSTFTALSGATTIAASNSSADDGITASISLGSGFTFTYGGNSFTTFKMNTNGWMQLGATSTTTQNFTAIASATALNAIAGFNRDLVISNANTSMSYLSTGSAPNRIFKIQWTGVSSYAGSSNFVPATGTFQIWLYETSNIVELHYGAFTAGSRTISATVQAGLLGNTAADYNAVSGATWTGATNSISSNSSSVIISTGVLPDNGRTFTFTPPLGTIAVSAGNSQTAAVGTPVATVPSVIVKNNGGVAVSGVTVTFAVASGGGSITGASATTNASGIATVGSWTLGTTAGTNTITATASGYSGSPVTFTATGTAGAATKIAFTTQPSNGTGGTAFTTQPVVTLQDQYGNTVTGTAQNVTVAIQNNPGGGTLSGTATVAVNTATGQATFSGLSIDKTGTGYTLTATGSTVSTTTGVIISSGFNITAGAAVKLAFTTQPGGGTGGTPWAQQPVVTLQDAGGNTVTGTAQNVTLAIQNNAGPGGTLSGTKTVAVNTATGQATFSGLSINKTGTGYTLTATGNNVSTTAGVIVSSGFNITVGPGAQYVVTSSNYTPVVGTSVTITAQLTDAGGNNVSATGATVTWSNTGTGTGGSFSSPTSTVTSGVATVSFTTGTISNSIYAIKALDGSAFTGTSPNITTTADVAAKIAFTTQPSNGTGGTAFTTQPVVTLQDQYGNTVTGTAQNVTVAIQNNPGGGTLSGTATVAVNTATGKATFSGLSIDKTGTGYTLTATGSTVSTTAGVIISSGFNITVGTAAKLAFTTQPGGGTGGTPWAQQPVVTLQDAGGNTVTGTAQNVTLAIQNNAGPGGTLSGTKTVAVNTATGQATFSGLSINKTGTGYTLTATGNNVSTTAGVIVSSGFNITVGAAFQLAVTTQPAAPSFNGGTLATQPVVVVQDAGGNTVTTSSASITATQSGGTWTIGGGTNPVTAVNGVATFSGLTASSNGNSAVTATITFTSGGLTQVISNPFIIPAPTYKSQINSVSFGTSPWCVGETRSVTVSVTNIGTATWTDANPDINIGLKWDSDPDFGAAPGNIGRQDAGNLAPGATRTYTFPVVTPVLTSGGLDHLTADVVYEGVSWFRDNTNGVGPGNLKFITPAITISTVPIISSVTATPATICNGGSSNLTVASSALAPTTIVDYDFNSGNSYTTLTPLLAAGISSAVTSAETFATFSGIAVGTGAFMTNTSTTSPLPTDLAIGTNNSSGTNTRSFVFTLTGANLPKYKTFKIYFQAQRSSTGATALNVFYNLNGAGFVNTGESPVTMAPNNGSYSQVTITLPSTVDNPTTSLAFGLALSGGSASGTTRIDNFEVQAVPVTTYSWAGSPSGTAGLPGTAGTDLTTNNSISVSPTATTNYVVTATNANGGGCSDNDNVNVTVNQKSANPSSATASATTICNGGSTTLTLNGGGGGTGEVIKWYSGSCGGTLVGTGNNLSVSPITSTTYYGRYEDGAPCNYNSLCASVAITVNQQSGNPTSATASATTICNNGSSSTTLTLNGGGGGTGETIAWYTGSCGGTLIGAGNNLTLSPTINTTYYGRYEDGAPCNYNSNCAIVTVTVNQQSADPIGASASPATICNGGSTNLNLTGGGGGTGEVIKWYTGSCGGTLAGTGNNLSVSPVITTTYYGRYEDGAPCNFNTSCATVTVTVNNPATTVSHTDATCNGTSTGTVTLVGSGGTAPYSYTLGSTTQLSGNFTGLAAGTYSYSVTDALNCLPATGSVIIDQPAIITATVSHADATCNGTATGTVTLTGSGGTLGYTYSLAGQPDNTIGTFTGLAAGSYNYSVTDVNGCSPATGSVIVGEPAAISTTVSHTDATCNGTSTGTVTLAGSGGTTPYSYTLGSTMQSSGSFMGLAAGTYSYSVTDANGCSPATGSVTISEPTAVTFTYTSVNESCNGGAIGSITITAAGGTVGSGYTYSDDGGGSYQSGNVFSGLSATSYTVIVKDGNGCTSTPQTVTITQPTAVTFTYTQVNESCNGASTGSITVTASGGTVGSGYTYSDDGGGSYQATNVFNNLSANTYSMIVKDGNGCVSAVQSVTITEPAAITATVNHTDATCNGTSTGTVILAGGGGTAPYSYTLGSTTQSSGNFTGLAAGTYSYSVTDANGCSPAIGSVTIGEPAAITATVNHTDATCNGTSTGTVTLAGSGGTAPYSYTLGSTTQSSGSFTGLAAGTYSYSVTDANGCSPATGSVTIGEPAAIIATVNHTDATCNGTSTGTVTLAGSGGNTPYSYTLGSTMQSSGNFTGLAAGTYSYSVTDANGCSPATGSVTIGEPTAVTATISGTTSICPGHSTNLTIALSGSGTITGTLSDGTTFSGNAPSVTVPVMPASTTTYTISSVTNGTCTGAGLGSATVTVSVDTWTGATDANWNNINNWSCYFVPTTVTDVDIPVVSSGNYPQVVYQPVAPATTVPIATARNITIETGASLIVSTNTLQISGSIINSGTFNASVGTLEFNGTLAQNIPGNTFTGNNTIRNLIISNNVDIGTTGGGNLNITGILSFGTSGNTLITNGNLTLESGTTLTAAIDVIMNDNHISGDVTVERYIATGVTLDPNDHPKTWQLLAVPTEGQTLKQSWMENAASNVTPAGNNVAGQPGNPNQGYGTMVTSNDVNNTQALADGFDAYTSPGPSVKAYDYMTGGYTGLPTATTSLYDQRGYFVFARGDRSVNAYNQTADHTILRTKGQLFTPDHLPQSTTIYADKFESIGNPYASPVDITKISATGGGVANYYYVWDPRLGGVYNYGAFVTFQLVGGHYQVQSPLTSPTYGTAGTVNDLIQSGQAFFMQATGSNGTVSFPESSKAANATFAKPFTRQADGGLVFDTGTRTASGQSTATSLRTSLYSVNTDGSTGAIVDGVLNQFGDNYSNEVTGEDARKAVNTGENLSIKTLNKLLVIEQRHTVVADDTIFLNLTNVRAQQYQFSFDAQNLNTVATGFVEDAYTKTSTPLNINGNTTVSFTVSGNAAASYAPDRFRIIFTPLKVLPVTFASVKAYRHDKDINVEWNVNNERNIKQYDVEKSADGKSFSTLAAAKATNNNGGAAVYVIADAKPFNGYNYYRVKTTDVNGAVSYSTIVKVEIGETKHEINIYPNPITDGQIHLQFSNEAAGNYGIRLLNKLGQVIMEKQVTRQDGSSTELIKWNFNLAHGMYNLEVTRPDGTVKNINVMY